jgi:hypothetical protein
VAESQPGWHYFTFSGRVKGGRSPEGDPGSTIALTPFIVRYCRPQIEREKSVVFLRKRTQGQVNTGICIYTKASNAPFT